MLVSYFCRFIPLSQYCKLSPLFISNFVVHDEMFQCMHCCFAVAAKFSKLTSIQLFAFCNIWEKRWFYRYIGFFASSHGSFQTARSCNCQGAVEKNDIKLQQCSEMAKVWSHHNDVCHFWIWCGCSKYVLPMGKRNKYANASYCCSLRRLQE